MDKRISRRRMIQGAVAATVTAGYSTGTFSLARAANNRPRGLALCLGLNHVEPSAYGGFDQPLGGCRNDCLRMKQIAKSQGFDDAIDLIDEKANIRDVRNHIKWAAHLLRPGDIFMLTCSSHGSWEADRNRDEADGRDETLCLWDGRWIDDDRLELFTRFAGGVRILFVVDACHSATTAKVLQAEESFNDAAEEEDARPRGIGLEQARSRPIQVAEENLKLSIDDLKEQESLKELKKVLAKSKEVPRAVGGPGDFGAQFNLPKGMTSPVRALPDQLAAYLSQFPHEVSREAAPSSKSLERMRAGVLTMAACQDDELAWDTGIEGVFTRALSDIWGNGQYRGSYNSFFDAVALPLRRIGRQHPEKETFGNTGTFLQQKPFTV